MAPSQPPEARWARSLVPADVGARVVVRHRLVDGRLTDALGSLESWADGVLVVRTRAGAVQVAQEALVAAKRVPPAPQRRAGRQTPADPGGAGHSGSGEGGAR